MLAYCKSRLRLPHTFSLYLLLKTGSVAMLLLCFCNNRFSPSSFPQNKLSFFCIMLALLVTATMLAYGDDRQGSDVPSSSTRLCSSSSQNAKRSLASHSFIYLDRILSILQLSENRIQCNGLMRQQ